MSKNDKKVLVRVWSGTPAHASLDTRQHRLLVDKIKSELKVDASYEGDYSIIDVFNKNNMVRRALVTHHGRSGYRYPYTPAQTDAEAILIDMYSGSLPENIKLYVTAHKHTTAGTIEHKGLKVVRVPCFVGFIPYAGSLSMLPHFLPDIGAWIIVVSKDGRIRLQEWLYPPFLFNEDKNEMIFSAKAEKRYVDPNKKTIEEPLTSLLAGAEKVILVLADLHIGELNAVAPLSFVSANSIIRDVPVTIANSKMYEYWQHLCYMSKVHFKPDEIWIIGDVFAGQMTVKFEKFRKMTLGNIDDQSDAALELVRQLLS